ncbi:MAG TPA: AAA family ATPase [candidate division Zixibacteria bacterium]|nr:AAA family ATPase [candidate division Zixibacteria bacterium]
MPIGQEHLSDQLKQRHVAAVLVDEAQNLSGEALEGPRLLSNLETDQEKRVEIVLTGQFDLETRPDQPDPQQLRRRIALRCRLVSLGRRESGACVDFRLRTAAYEGAFPRERSTRGPARRDSARNISESRPFPIYLPMKCSEACLCRSAGA